MLYSNLYSNFDIIEDDKFWSHIGEIEFGASQKKSRKKSKKKSRKKQTE